MRTQNILLAVGSILPLVSSTPVAKALIGKSYTNWDWYVTCPRLSPKNLSSIASARIKV